MARSVLLIRHGETHLNIDQNRFSGTADIGLTEIGRDQCRQLNHLLRGRMVQEVYSSPLKRSIESAEIIFPDRVPETRPALIEFDYGAYEGKAKALISADDPVVKQWELNPGDLTFPGGGNIRQHSVNSLVGLYEIMEESNALTIACVSHKTTIRLIVAQVLKLDINNFRLIPCSNCSITELEFSQEHKLSLVALNITASILSFKG